MGYSRPQLKLLCESDINRLHTGALKILERTGVEFYDPGVVEILNGAGARTDDGKRVRIPNNLVEKALSSAPRRIEIANRSGYRTLLLEGCNSYFGTGSDTPVTIDPFTGERREVLLKDIENITRLSDFLPNIDFCMCMGIARNVPEKKSDIHHFYAMLSNTAKPLVFTSWDLDNLRVIYDLCVAVIGSEANWKRSPFAMLYSMPTTPLMHTKETCQQIVFCAEKRIPLIYVAGPSAGGTGPIKMAGSIVLGTAEFLSGLVLHQLVCAGAPIVCGTGPSHLDMSTGVIPYGSPEHFLSYSAVRELTRHYGLPSWGLGGCSDAKLVDQQAGIEAAFSLLVSTLAGINLIHDVGYLESGIASSCEMLVMSDEVISMVKRFLKGLEVSDEALSLESIDKVGPGGSFLEEDQTLKYFKEDIWYPEIFDRRNHQQWLDQGAKSFGDRVTEKVRWILENHQPETLPPDISTTFRGILMKADYAS
jgi:trimethylamine--corrinoid protein Co-methyltransferase